METVAFQNSERLKDQVSLLYATENAVVYIHAPANKVRHLVEESREGNQITGVRPKDGATIALSNITSIRHVPCEEGIVIRHQRGTRQKTTICVGHRRGSIADGLARAVGISSQRSTRRATFREVSFLPGVVMLMVGLGAAILSFLAVSWDNPNEVEPGSLTSPRAKGLAALIQYLGAPTVIGIACTAVLCVAGWWAYSYIRRPDVTVYER